MNGMLFYTGRAGKASRMRSPFSRELTEAREGAMQVPGGDHPRPRDQPVQRPRERTANTLTGLAGEYKSDSATLC